VRFCLSLPPIFRLLADGILGIVLQRREAVIRRRTGLGVLEPLNLSVAFFGLIVNLIVGDKLRTFGKRRSQRVPTFQATLWLGSVSISNTTGSSRSKSSPRERSSSRTILGAKHMGSRSICRNSSSDFLLY